VGNPASTMRPLARVAPRWRTEMYARLGERLDRVLGDKTAKAFEPLKVTTVADLLLHLPRRYFSGTELSDLSALRVGEEVAVLAEVVDSRTLPFSGRRSGRGGFRDSPPGRLQAIITDRRGELTLTFFGPPHLLTYWEKQLSRGSRGIFAGKVTEFRGDLQLAHPDFVMVDDEGAIVGGAKRNEQLAEVSRAPLIGLYPATSKLQTWTIAATINLVLETLSDVADPLPEAIRREAGVPDLHTAWRAVHTPQSRAEIESGRTRLRFDEAFGLQLTMAHRRADAARHGAVSRRAVTGGLLDAFDARLPFELTAGQLEVSAEIMSDLAEPHPMQRLLQGEVGSGKTVVALRAMLTTIDAGGQAALLAPTEVLAGQHFRTITAMLGDLAGGGLLAGDQSTEVVLITGSMPAAARRAANERAASGEAGIVIGTHALLSAGVSFADLGLVVVDEQHRFGVEQRAALSAKADARPHVLVMTATPIPRSVAMTVFGDLEISTLRELPAGRAEVSTVVVDTSRHPAWVERAWARVIEEVAQGRQAYVVGARISSESATPAAGEDLEPGAEAASGSEPPPAAVEDLFAELSAGPLSAVTVEMLHGRLSGEEKDAVMGRFMTGETSVLVATTVIEVGVDVPNASMMVICDADRFGISQLHQLRGRIGRGTHPGVCLLLSSADTHSQARQRLDAVAATRDGFDLAEIDLEQRREGDVLGASQSGVRSSLRLLRVLADADLIGQARAVADRCIADDPDLDEPGLADAVTAVEMRAAGEWLERS
jgi:ATP-dependent DNA helicase RecG